MIEYTWKIEQCEYNAQTGAIENVHWRLNAVDGDYTDSIYGSQSLNANPNSESFIPYPEVTEQQIIDWVKNELGSERVTEIESIVMAQIEARKTPKTLTGLPWE